MIKKNRLTIIEVAKIAGVSRQTVSRVLNNRPDVAPETRQRVLDVVQELGYQPSQIARSLSQGESRTLGVVAYAIFYYGPSRTLSVVENQANHLGYSLALSLTHDLADIDVLKVLGELNAQHVDGIIWAVPQYGDVREQFIKAIENFSIPIVCANMEPYDSYSLVDSDNFEGGKLATQHLIDQGFTEIGIITGPMGWLVSRQRYEGYKAAKAIADLSHNDELVVQGDWTPRSGYEGMVRLLERNSKLEAVFACNDQMALGVLRAAALAGKRIPEDIALVGYDNIPEAEFFCTPLTTVRQNFGEQGKIMADEFERRIRNRRNNISDIPRSEFLLPELLVRESSIRSES
jgi:DNA-binding LacI/PurR family transcriptional regulator